MKKPIDPYDTLGVPENADEATIKSAWREKTRQHHPDHNPGADPEPFLAIQKAYSILIDPNLRSQYDQFGSTDPNGIQKLAEKEIVALFLNLIDNVQDLEHTNLVEIANGAIDNSQADFQKKVNTTKKAITRLTTASRRLRHKSKNNPVAFVIKSKIKGLCNDIKTLRFNIRVGDEMKKMLEDFEYDLDAVDPLSHFMTMPVQKSPFKFPTA